VVSGDPAADANDARLDRSPNAIRAMFGAVARRYDLLNHLLSLRQDVRWRRRLVVALRAAPGGPVLDLATGTGDVALGVEARPVVGADFCLDMLALARRKALRRGAGVPWVAADALALPFRPASFAAVTVAFGVRNFADLAAGLAEVGRVLRPGGMLAVLEFHRPRSFAVSTLSALWNRMVVTPVGSLLSDDRTAYAYLPASVATFARVEELRDELARVGFRVDGSERLSGGIAVLTTAQRRA
jgi:demethylmenaquinone methyltransferase/2-methoxy-6-polyprenyl-1,4-benzoquinol methylase